MTPLNIVPTFQLYGETHWPTPDLLHCETIAERSRHHDWHIQPHRHADLMHLLLLNEGRVSLQLAHSETSLEGSLAICVPATVIHGFRFSSDTQGHIVTLARPLVATLRKRLVQSEVLTKAGYYPLEDQPERKTLSILAEQLNAEYRDGIQHQEGREAMLQALIEGVTIQLWRRARRRQRTTIHHHDRGQAHLQRYQALIESRFHQQPSIPQLAAELGISDAHLNDLCRRLTGRSALQLLHTRLLLEAKRQLTYTNLSIAHISERLGFSEPTYFTRFFKRGVKLTPKAFRQRPPSS